MNPSPFDTHNPSVSGKIVAALERISEAFRVLLWNEGKAHGLSPLQMQILIFLLHHDAEELRKVSHLAAEFNLTKATVSEAVKALEKKGWIEKDFGQTDQRSFAIGLTAAGEALAGQMERFATNIEAPIASLAADAQADLLLNLLSIISHLHQQGVISVQRMCFTCRHYRPGQAGQPHFCQLLNAPLTTAELRVDCPEHEAAAAL